jgi:hypothetical protein
MPDQEKSGNNQEKRPELGYANTDVAELVQSEQAANRDEEGSPNLISGATGFSQANDAAYGKDERPEMPQNIGVDDAEAVEQQHDSDAGDHQP